MTPASDVRRTWLGPGGLNLLCVWREDCASLYNEIFTERCYAPDGLQLGVSPVIIDVGANIGMFSLFAFLNWPDASVIAIEPVPELAEICRLNLTGHRSTVIQAACTGIEEETEFRYYPAYPMISSRAPSPNIESISRTLRSSGLVPSECDDEDMLELIRAKMSSAVEIPMRTQRLDNLLWDRFEDRFYSVDLLKVDVEGDELEVLRGSERTLAKTQNVIVEAEIGERATEVVDLLASYGFKTSTYQVASYAGTDLCLVWGSKDLGLLGS